jgi:hypothetical protein
MTNEKLYTSAEEKKIHDAYKDWIKLLQDTNNTDLLKDPYNIWLEAWHVAIITQDRPTLLIL